MSKTLLIPKTKHPDTVKVPLYEALYDGVCPDCENSLVWELYPDAEDPTYNADCDCGKWTMSFTHAKVDFERREE